MHGPFSPAIPDDENRIFVPMVLTAIAVDKDKNSQHALKWAVDNIVAINHAVSLIHVRCRHPHNNSSGTIPKDGHAPKPDTVTDAGKDHLESETSQLLVCCRAFCARKGIQVKEVILEDNDVARALVNYITSNHIHNIILGAARTSLAKKFRNHDVPSSILKSAPEFCGVYVISKGKPANIRLARGPGAIRPKQPSLKTTHHCDPDDAIQTPFGRVDRTPIGPYPTPERKSFDWNTDKAKPASWQKHGSGGSIDYTPQPMRTSTSHESLLDDMDFHEDSGVRSSDFGDDFELSAPIENSGGPSTPTSNVVGHNRDMEAEMKRLKLELKQTMDMYSTACKEAINAKQKAKELHLWKIEEERKLDEARQAEEAAFAMAEMEKAKCKAAIEAAEAAQKIAELEARKRMNAERKMRREAEEKQRALDVLHQNDVRYRKYAIEEIELATENFSNALKIGEGGYGPVYGAALDHTPVAIKVLRPDASQGRKQFQQEVEVLCCIRHPNMVLLLGACPEYGCLVYEYMDNGSLEDRLFRRNNTPPIPWPVRFKIAAEIATALLFLHQAKPEPLVHRDLKPANILLDRNYTSKISDVGLSRLVPPSVANQVTQYRLTSTAGTFCYIDPEYQSTGMLGIKSDIFSLGVLLLQIITAKPPMALAHNVGTAIERGKFVEWLDPTVEDWPVEEAMRFAKLALKCAEMRRKDRPDLGTVVLPELNRLRNLGHAYESGYSVGINRSSFSSESRNVPSTVAKSAVDQVNQEMVETTTPDTAPCASELQSTKLENGSTKETRTTEQVAETTTEHLAEATMEQVVEATIEQLAQPTMENNNNDKISSSVSSNSSNATPPVHELDQVNTHTMGENNPNTEAPECTKPENASTEEARLTEQLGESLTNQSSNNSSFASSSSNSSNSTPCLEQAMDQVNNDTMGMDNPIIEAPEFTKPENESREEAGTMDQLTELMAKHNSIDNSSFGSISSNSSNTSSRSESPAKTDQVNLEVEGMCKPKTGPPCISKLRRTESTHKSREGTGLTEQSFKSMTKQSSSSSSSSGSSHSFCSVSSNSSNSIPRSKSNLGSLMGGHNKDSPRRLKRRPTIPTCKPSFL